MWKELYIAIYVSAFVISGSIELVDLEKCSQCLSQRSRISASQRSNQNINIATPDQESKQVFERSNVCPRTKIGAHNNYIGVPPPRPPPCT